MPEVAAPPAPPPSFDDFISSEIGTGLEQEQLATLQAKQAPVVEPPAPVEATPAPAAESPAKAAPLKEGELKAALEFSTDLDTTPTEPKPAGERYSEKPPGTVTEKASAAWATLRHRATQADSLEKTNADLAAKLKTLEEQTQGLADKEIIPKDIWAKSQRDQEELTSSLRMTNLEATPEYKGAIAVPMQQIRDSAKTLADRYNVPYRDVLNALEEPDEQRQSEMLSDLADIGGFKDKNKLDLFRYGDQMRDLQFKRGKLVENVSKTMEFIAHQRKMEGEKQQKQYETNWNSALDRAWGTLEKGIWTFQRSETDSDWNHSLDALKDTVKNVKYYELPMERQAQILYQAAMVPRVLKALAQAKEMINSQNEALKKYSASTPGSAAGSAGPSTPAMSGDSRGFVDSMM